MIIYHDYLGAKYQISTEQLHHVLTVKVGGQTFIENVKARTVGLTGPLTYAQVCDYAKRKIARMVG